MSASSLNKPFETPIDSDEFIWRYMDVTKFISIVFSKSLYFPSVTVLRQSDPYESTLPQSIIDAQSVYDSSQMGWKESEHEKVLKKYVPFLEKSWEEEAFKFASSAYASCWHVNHHESAAMWRLYLKSSEGIAIRSTTKRLTQALEPHMIGPTRDKRGKFLIGMVRYIDYAEELFNPYNKLNFVTHKRKSYEHERELRAVYWRDRKADDAPSPVSPGIAFKVDLDILIDRIFVSPDSDQLTLSVVNEIKKRIRPRLKAEVVRSKLTSLK